MNLDLLRQRVIYSGRVKNNIVVMDNIAYEVEDELAKKYLVCSNTYIYNSYL